MSSTEATRSEVVQRAIWPDDREAPLRKVRCSGCGSHNRVRVSVAVLRPERVRCGSCDDALFAGADEPLTGIASSAYQHGLDRRALSALQSLPGAPQLLRWLHEHLGDRTLWLQLMSDAVLCGEEQFPELLALLDRARHRLDLPTRPTLFLGESPHMNAMTSGVEHPVVVVRSALLDQMEDDELVAVLGHELGHLHADHPLYQSLAYTLLQSGAAASQVLRMFGLPLQRALLRWSRYAELTADRAGLLACRDLGAAVTTLVTFAGGNRPGTTKRTKIQLAPFVRQCRELARMSATDPVDRALGGYLTMDRTHPHVAWRVMHLIQWVEHGGYLDILSGRYARRAPRPALPLAATERSAEA